MISHSGRDVGDEAGGNNNQQLSSSSSSPSFSSLSHVQSVPMREDKKVPPHRNKDIIQQFRQMEPGTMDGSRNGPQDGPRNEPQGGPRIGPQDGPRNGPQEEVRNEPNRNGSVIRNGPGPGGLAGRDEPGRDGPARDGLAGRDGPGQDGAWDGFNGAGRDGLFRKGRGCESLSRDGHNRNEPRRDGLDRGGRDRDGPGRSEPRRDGPSRDGPCRDGPGRDDRPSGRPNRDGSGVNERVCGGNSSGSSPMSAISGTVGEESADLSINLNRPVTDQLIRGTGAGGEGGTRPWDGTGNKGATPAAQDQDVGGGMLPSPWGGNHWAGTGDSALNGRRDAGAGKRDISNDHSGNFGTSSSSSSFITSSPRGPSGSSSNGGYKTATSSRNDIRDGQQHSDVISFQRDTLDGRDARDGRDRRHVSDARDTRDVRRCDVMSFGSVQPSFSVESGRTSPRRRVAGVTESSSDQSSRLSYDVNKMTKPDNGKSISVSRHYQPSVPHEYTPMMLSSPGGYHTIGGLFPPPPPLHPLTPLAGTDHGNLALITNSYLLQQQQQQQQQQPQQQLRLLQQSSSARSGDSPLLASPTSTARLEQMWQTKYPSRAMPPAWMLYQFQDELRFHDIPSTSSSSSSVLGGESREGGVGASEPTPVHQRSRDGQGPVDRAPRPGGVETPGSGERASGMMWEHGGREEKLGRQLKRDRIERERSFAEGLEWERGGREREERGGREREERGGREKEERGGREREERGGREREERGGRREELVDVDRKDYNRQPEREALRERERMSSSDRQRFDREQTGGGGGQGGGGGPRGRGVGLEEQVVRSGNPVDNRDNRRAAGWDQYEHGARRRLEQQQHQQQLQQQQLQQQQQRDRDSAMTSHLQLLSSSSSANDAVNQHFQKSLQHLGAPSSTSGHRIAAPSPPSQPVPSGASLTDVTSLPLVAPPPRGVSIEVAMPSFTYRAPLNSLYGASVKIERQKNPVCELRLDLSASSGPSGATTDYDKMTSLETRSSRDGSPHPSRPSPCSSSSSSSRLPSVPPLNPATAAVYQSATKPELLFNLYGYQPDKYTDLHFSTPTNLNSDRTNDRVRGGGSSPGGGGRISSSDGRSFHPASAEQHQAAYGRARTGPREPPGGDPRYDLTAPPAAHGRGGTTSVIVHRRDRDSSPHHFSHPSSHSSPHPLPHPGTHSYPDPTVSYRARGSITLGTAGDKQPRAAHEETRWMPSSGAAIDLVCRYPPVSTDIRDPTDINQHNNKNNSNYNGPWLSRSTDSTPVISFVTSSSVVQFGVDRLVSTTSAHTPASRPVLDGPSSMQVHNSKSYPQLNNLQQHQQHVTVSNLIQQGLVPNPMYTSDTISTANTNHAKVYPSKLYDVQQSLGAPLTLLSHPGVIPGGDKASIPSGGGSNVGGKRRTKTETGGTTGAGAPSRRKKAKLDTASVSVQSSDREQCGTSGQHSGSVAVYIHGSRDPVQANNGRSSSMLFGGVSVNKVTQASGMMCESSGKESGGFGTTGYINSFKSFVDNTVQNAFFSDMRKEEMEGGSGGGMEGGRVGAGLHMERPLCTDRNAIRRLVVDSNTTVSSGTISLSSSSSPALFSRSAATAGSTDPTLLSHSTEVATRSCSNSAPSIVKANGYVDTDSDTLSAHSPVCHSPTTPVVPTHSSSFLITTLMGEPTVVKSSLQQPVNAENSNHTSSSPPHCSQTPPLSSLSSSHHYTKKAWLQRYSDEDKTGISVMSFIGQETGDMKCSSPHSATLDLVKAGAPDKMNRVKVEVQLDVDAEVRVPDVSSSDMCLGSDVSMCKTDAEPCNSKLCSTLVGGESLKMEAAVGTSSSSEELLKIEKKDCSEEDAGLLYVKSSCEDNVLSSMTKERGGREGREGAGLGAGGGGVGSLKPFMKRSKIRSADISCSAVESDDTKSVDSSGSTSRKTRSKKQESSLVPSSSSTTTTMTTTKKRRHGDDNEDEEYSPPMPKLVQERASRIAHEQDEGLEESSSLLSTPQPLDRMNKTRTTATTIKSSSKPVSVCERKMAARALEQKNKTKSKNKDNPLSAVEQKTLKRVADNKRRRTKEAFLQDGSCTDVTPKLIKCRECKMSQSQRNKSTPNIFCRFYEFRKLRYSAKGFLSVAGFSRPMDADADDIAYWMPIKSATRLQADQAKYILANIVRSFITLLDNENCPAEPPQSRCKRAWKRAIEGVREMCDACDATLFNIHWSCQKCGFSVCTQCYRECSCNHSTSLGPTAQRNWLTCSANHQPHELDSLMVTQIIPSDVQSVIERMLRDVLEKYGKTSNGPTHTSLQDAHLSNDLTSQTISEQNNIKLNGYGNKSIPSKHSAQAGAESKKHVLEDIAGNSEKNGISVEDKSDDHKDSADNGQSTDDKDVDEKMASCLELDGFISSKLLQNCNLSSLITSELSVNCNSVRHHWLDENRLLYLEDPLADNLQEFQKHWRRSLPVLVTDCTGTTAIPGLWTPDSFRREFAGLKADLVDCASGEVLRGQSTEKFWHGFETAGTVKHKNGVCAGAGAGTGAVLRLKDWPAVEDRVGARWHRDLARTLPIREYTLQTGAYNLVSHLPDFFVKPELSVRIHAGYGSALYPASVAFTKLRVDPADCVNVLMYVEVPSTESDVLKAALSKSLKESGCCNATKNNLTSMRGKKIGAVWHIFRPQDAEQIRNFISKSCNGSGRQQHSDKTSSNIDVLSSNSFYLDRAQRAKLLANNSIQCCTVVQCLGDAVFVPAMSPYQVKNLHSCISASKEFLSPESIEMCYTSARQKRKTTSSSSSADSATNNQEEHLQEERMFNMPG